MIGRHIRVTVFQPFESRVGLDTVIGLQFNYDPEVIALLKAALREARGWQRRGNLGGWLAEYRCWFVERIAWPHVRRRLLGAGCTLDGDPAEGPARDPGPAPDARPDDWRPQVRLLVKRWSGALARRFHPDRGGSDRDMVVINVAHDLLLEVLGIR
jgi:hypothetical protein